MLRTHWSTAASIVSGPLLQAFDIIAPNPVITQLNQLDDQSFRDNLVIANNVQIQTVVFVEKQELTNQLIKLNSSARSAMLTQQDWKDMGLEKSTSSMKSTITNSTNNRGMISKKGGFNPYYVKLALGNVVIVGRHIAYLDRVHVVNSATSPSGAAPIISKVSPPDGSSGAAAGDVITIAGSNFGATQASSTVTIGSVVATKVVSWTDALIKVTVPDGVQPGHAINVKVSAGGGDSAPSSIAILPSVTNLNPTADVVGNSVIISGNFGDIPGKVVFGNTDANPTWGKSSITTRVPDGVDPGTVDVVVTVDGQSSQRGPATKFTVNPDTSDPSPKSGQIGTPVTLTGHFGKTKSTVTLASTPVTNLNFDPSGTSITFKVPAVTAGKGQALVITVANGGGTLNSTFDVLPNLNAPDPSLKLAPGDKLSITGNFGAKKGTVTVGGQAADVADPDFTTTAIKATVPLVGAGAQDVVVVTNDGLRSTPKSLNIKPSPPQLSPASGPVGKTIQITGANYGVDPIRVTFGTQPAVDATFANGKFTVNVPSSLSAGSVNVVVTVKGISSDPATFTVTAQ